MRKHGYILITILIIFIGSIGCILYVNNNNLEDKNLTIYELHSKIQELKKENADIKSKLEVHEKSEKYFSTIAELSKEFTDACATGNKKVLKELLDNKYVLQERDDEDILAVYEYEGEAIEVPLYDKNPEYEYKDMLIYGYGYDFEKDAVSVHLRKFYINKNGELASPPGVMHLDFKEIGNTWKIILLEPDI